MIVQLLMHNGWVRCQESQTTSTIRHNIIKNRCELADELHLSVNGIRMRRFREDGKYAGPLVLLKPVGNPYVMATAWHCTELCFCREFVQINYCNNNVVTTM